MVRARLAVEGVIRRRSRLVSMLMVLMGDVEPVVERSRHPIVSTQGNSTRQAACQCTVHTLE